MRRALCATLALWSGLLPAAPTVTKVEPPNWWAAHTINPVRLLIRGADLYRARLAAPAGFRVSNVRVNAAGTYVFADLAIPREAAPGEYPLELTTATGRAVVPFSISQPLAANGRFQGFSPDDVIYLLMPDRFANGDPSNDDPAVSRGLYDRAKPHFYHGGDLQGVIDRLAYLKSLGVTAIWMTPIYDNNNGLNARETDNGAPVTDYHGYGAVDYYGVEEHFGTLSLARKLVDEAHRLGMKVIQDQVENHVGPYHPWVADPPLPNWFHGTVQTHLKETWQTWTLGDPHAAPSLRRTVTEGWFADILPDMNQGEEEVARYEVQNTLWWLGVVGFDGIRQDTWPYVERTFWRHWMTAIKAQYPTARVVGEVFEPDPALVSFFQGGRTQADGIDTLVDSLFDFPSYFQIRESFGRGKPVRGLATMLGHDRLYPDPTRLVTFLGLHDVARFMNEPGATTQGLRLAFTFLLTSRGIPMIYYGDEIAMPGGADPDCRRDFPGGWPGDPVNAFTGPGLSEDQRGVQDHVRRLARLRAARSSLRTGDQKTLLAEEQQWVYARLAGEETTLVAINNNTAPADVRVPVESRYHSWKGQLGAGSIQVQQGEARIHLAPRAAEIYFAE